MDNYSILKNLVSDYGNLPDVCAVALGGSSVVNTADNHSDFDIYIYCDKEPEVELRKQTAQKYSTYMEIDNHYFETGDVFYLKESGKPVDIMYRNIKDFENNIKRVWIDYQASMGYTTCFVDNINKSEILYDKTGRLKALQDITKTPYPDKLAENIINKNFGYLKDVMFSYYDQLESALNRLDYVSVNHRSSAFLASYFDVIFAKNKVLHPGEKKLVQFAKLNCKILPKDFENDVNTLATGEISKRLECAQNLVENLRQIL